MGDGIYDVLTREQVEKLADLLKLVVRAGHGSVTVRAKNGKIRFVRFDIEGEFETDGKVRALDQLNS